MSKTDSNEHYEDTRARVKRLIREQNYVAAQTVANAYPDPDHRAELAGMVIEAIASELSQNRLPRERAVYLRSLLVWVFRDFPGLASIYREQVRIAAGQSTGFDWLEGVRNMSDVASGRKSFEAGVEDTVESVRRNVENADEVRDFFSEAGKNISGALDEFGKVFRSMSGSGSRDRSRSWYREDESSASDQPESPDEDSGRSDHDDRHDHDGAADDDAHITVEIVTDDEDES